MFLLDINFIFPLYVVRVTNYAIYINKNLYSRQLSPVRQEGAS
jgi:hypothetical protein